MALLLAQTWQFKYQTWPFKSQTHTQISS